jgi:hypothetical protein
LKKVIFFFFVYSYLGSFSIEMCLVLFQTLPRYSGDGRGRVATVHSAGFIRLKIPILRCVFVTCQPKVKASTETTFRL